MESITTENIDETLARELKMADMYISCFMYSKAVFCLKRLITLYHNIEASYRLGALYMKKSFWGRSYEKAFCYLQYSAERGHCGAQYYLSKFYEYGLLDEFDLEQAYEWLNKAAEQKEPRALMHLFDWYSLGIRVRPDMEMAIKYLMASAEAGNPEAYSKLGSMYETGEFFDKDNAKAISYYEKAADLQDAYALYRLGCLYWSGKQLAFDLDKAMFYLEKSARLDFADAQYMLARLNCSVFCNDVSERFRWLTSAVANKHVMATYELGCMYLFGDRNFPSDIAKAVELFQAAASLGSEEAKKVLRSV